MTNIIAGHELTPGKTVKDHIHVHGTELHVPHVLLCGMETGPTALISAGIHNAEYVGIPSVLIERGQLSLFSREEIEADKADVRNILRRIGILPGDYTTYEKTELAEYSDDAPCTGCWYPEKQVGDRFRKGEKLGEIRDYFGRSLFTEFAPCDGVLIHQCASLNIIEKGPMVTYGVRQNDSE